MPNFRFVMPLAAVFLTVFSLGTAQAILIDNFAATQGGGVQLVVGTNTNEDTGLGTNVFGQGIRRLWMNGVVNGGGAEQAYSQVDPTAGSWTTSNPDGWDSTAGVTYYGWALVGATLRDATHPLSDMYFQARIASADPGVSMHVSLQDTVGRNAYYTWDNLPSAGVVNVKLLDFTVTNPLFSFNAVMLATVTLEGPSGWNAVITELETTYDPDFSSIPEPSSAVVMLGVFGVGGLTRFVRRRRAS